jgi:hypothetical protein
VAALGEVASTKFLARALVVVEEAVEEGAVGGEEAIGDQLHAYDYE